MNWTKSAEKLPQKRCFYFVSTNNGLNFFLYENEIWLMYDDCCEEWIKQDTPDFWMEIPHIPK